LPSMTVVRSSSAGISRASNWLSTNAGLKKWPVRPWRRRMISSSGTWIRKI
jgi:hypothetical protein